MALVVLISIIFRNFACVDASTADACHDHEGFWSVEGTSLLQMGMAMNAGNEHHHVLTVQEYIANAEAWHPRHENIPRLAMLGGGMGILLLVAAGVSFGLGLIGKSKDHTLSRSPAPSGSFCAAGDSHLGYAHEESFEGSKDPHEGIKLKEGKDKDDKPSMWVVLFFVLGHAASASSLTVVNKVAMEKFHPQVASGQHHGREHLGGYVWTLVLIQFASAAILVRAAGALGIMKVERFELGRAMHYFPAAGMFMITIVAGNAVMNYTNVNTFLILRALVPIPCALLETALYSDPYPPMWSWLGLAVAMFGAGLYAVSIGDFEIRSLAWALIFLTTMPIDGILIKHSISTSNLSSWGLVYYNNLLAAIPLTAYVYLFELSDWNKVQEMLSAIEAPGARSPVLLSCAVGLGISFFQLNARYYISATAFMILGVANKFLTVLWSEVFFDTNGFNAQLGILLTLGGAVFWQLSVGGSGTVKLRRRRTSSFDAHRNYLPIFLTLGALAWAALIQHSQMVAG